MRPVIWRYQQNFYIFVEDGVYCMGPHYQDVKFKSLIWVLLDSDHTANDITPLIDDMWFFVIYTTSPAKQCWSYLLKYFSVKIIVMNLWSLGEMPQAYVLTFVLLYIMLMQFQCSVAPR